VSVNDPNEGLGEFLSTGRQRHTGQAIGSVEDIRPDTLFKVGGLEISAEQAVSAGYLSKGRDGRYHTCFGWNQRAAADEGSRQLRRERRRGRCPRRSIHRRNWRSNRRAD
jgi:hypothetical protein